MNYVRHVYHGTSDEIKAVDGSLVLRLGMTEQELRAAAQAAGTTIGPGRWPDERYVVARHICIGISRKGCVEFIELSSFAADLRFYGATVLGDTQRGVIEAIRNINPLTPTTIVFEDGGAMCPELRLALWAENWTGEDEPVMAAAIHALDYYNKGSPQGE